MGDPKGELKTPETPTAFDGSSAVTETGTAEQLYVCSSQSPIYLEIAQRKAAGFDAGCFWEIKKKKVTIRR